MVRGVRLEVDWTGRPVPPSDVHHDVVGLYERHALDYDRDRGRGLQERDWLARFAGFVRPGGAVLDIGCGMAEPIARHLVGMGFQITGLDASPAMISLCRERLPRSEWLVGDMRELALGRRFDGLLAWDSLFHLKGDEQSAMFPRFAAHARPGAPLMFTSGSARGESVGSYCGEPLFHASLAPSEYERCLTRNRFRVRAHEDDDAECGHHTVWLATYDPTRQS